MFGDSLSALKGKIVVVRANGFTYEGKLIEVAPTYVLVRRQQGFVQLPMHTVQSIKEKAKMAVELKEVDSSFFAFNEPKKED